MFYLIQHWKILSRHPVKACFFILLSFLLIGSIIYRKELSSQYLSKVLTHQQPYFYVLFSSKENHNLIIRRMLDIQWIRSIHTVGSNNIQNKISKSRIKLPKSLGEKYIGLKIVLGLENTEYAYEIIGNYAKNLFQVEKPVIGRLIGFNPKASSREAFLRDWGIFLIIIPIFLFWIILTFLLSVQIQRSSYIIETYQRRKNVGFKFALIGNGVLFLIILSICASFRVPNISELMITFLMILCVTLFHLKKYSWKS